MANAYATIADGGVHHDWFTIKQVSRSSDGKVLYKAPKATNRVLSEDISSDVSYALQDVVKNGTGQNAQALGRPAAGKTGTATNADGDVSSSWFVGYTPQVATAVMYVRGKGNEALNGFLPSYFGANFPTYTWRAVMTLDPGRAADRELPARGQRRRHRAHQRARAVHASSGPVADPHPEQHAEAQARSPSPPRARRRPPRPRRRHRARRRPRPRPRGLLRPGHRPRLHTSPVTEGAATTGGDALRDPGDGIGPRPPGRSPDPHGVVAPTRSDPLARAFSEVVGGPVGRHGLPHRWWTPVRVLLALTAVVMGLAILQHQPCLKTYFGDDQARYAKMCYSDVPYLYTGRGLSEGQWPYGENGGRYPAMEYPVGIVLRRRGARPRRCCWRRTGRRSTSGGPPSRRLMEPARECRTRRTPTSSPPRSCSAWRRWRARGSWPGLTAVGPGTRCRSCSPRRCC